MVLLGWFRALHRGAPKLGKTSEGSALIGLGLENAGELLSRRPETLSVQEFAELAARLDALRERPTGDVTP